MRDVMAYAVNRDRCENPSFADKAQEHTFAALKVSALCLLAASVGLKVWRASRGPPKSSDAPGDSETPKAPSSKAENVILRAEKSVDGMLYLFIGCLVWLKFNTMPALLQTSTWRPWSVSGLDSLAISISGSYMAYAGMCKLLGEADALGTACFLWGVITAYFVSEKIRHG